MHCPTALGAVGSATPAMQGLTAWGQWTVQLLQCAAAPPGGSGQCNSRNALPHRSRAVGSATAAMHCPTAWGQWAAELLICVASLPGGSGQCNSCNALPHCMGAGDSATRAMRCLTALGAVGSGTPGLHCLTPWEQWAARLLQCTASLPGGRRQCNSCNALPHCLGAGDNATPAMHCLTAWGQ